MSSGRAGGAGEPEGGAWEDLPDPDGDPRGLAVLMPGRNYPVASPLLAFAGRAAREHGWRVRVLHWDLAPSPDDPRADEWVRDRLAEAVGDHTGPVLVVAKSLSTRSAPYVAERGWDAVWLTPLLMLPHVADAIATHPGRQLLVGGTADDIAWDPSVASRLVDAGCEVLEVPDADHTMGVDDDAVRTAEVHVQVTRAIHAFLKGATG